MRFFNKQKRNSKTETSYNGVEKLISASQFTPTQAPDHFKQALLAELLSKREQPVMQRSFTPEKEKSRFSLFTLAPAFAAFSILVFAVVGLMVYMRDGQPGSQGTQGGQTLAINEHIPADQREGAFELKALNETEKGINPSTAFQLVAHVKVTAEQIKSALTFSPAIAYAMEETSENTFRITPESPLDAGKLVVARLNVAFATENGGQQTQTYSWSYQVEEKFQINATLPRHQSTSAPIDTTIEITFSHAGFEYTPEQFSITPAVKGRFEVHDKTLVFVPAERLKQTTLYTVQLQKDVTLPLTHETLEKELSFQFETQQEDYSEVLDTTLTSLAPAIRQVTNEEIPGFLISTWGGNALQGNIPFSIYQFETKEEYQAAVSARQSVPDWSYYAERQWSYPTQELQLHSSTDVSVQSRADNSFQQYVAAPSELAAGYYLIQVGGPDQHLQSLLEVTDISAYVTLSATDLVVWSHDLKTGDVFAGATVTLTDGTALGTTNAEGVLRVQTPALLLDKTKDPELAVTIEKDQRSITIPFTGILENYNTFDTPTRLTEQSHWSYVYVDQPIYHPGDTVNVWGLVEPRYQTNSDEKLTLQLSNVYYEYFPEDVVIYGTQDITPGQYHTFQSQFQLGQLFPGQYQVAILKGDTVLFKKIFTVQTSAKPVYTVDATPTHHAVITGTEFTHTINAQYFDGSPVKDLELLVDQTTLSTNEEGIAQHTTRFENFFPEQISFQSLAIRPQQAEEGEMDDYVYIRVLPAAELIQATTDTKDKTIVVKGTLHAADLDAYNAEGSNEELLYGALIPNERVTVHVLKEWTVQRETGTVYDPINKKSVPIYAYEPFKEDLFTKEVTTNAEGAFTLEFEAEEEKNYDITISTVDSAGRTASRKTYGGIMNYNDYLASLDHNMNLYFEENAQEQEREKDVSLHEEVTVALYNNNTQPKATEHPAYLYLQAQNGIRDLAVSNQPTYQFTFGEEDIPSVSLQAVWFDGTTYWPTTADTNYYGSGATVASYKEADRVLKTEVKTDKESYRPGEKVNAVVTVTRPDGEPAKDALVNVNVIDEALYAMLEENAFSYYNDTKSPFEEVLYRDIHSGIYHAYASHRPLPGIYGDGGGGGDNLTKRIHFPDKVFFQTVTTNRDGKAEISFTLPHNITSWRITTHSYDADRFASSQVSSLIVTQPFFVRAVMSESYHVGDQPVLTAHPAGERLVTTNDVKWTFASPTLALPQTTATTKASDPVRIPLPALTEGTHELTITAKHGNDTDIIVRQFTVVASYLSVPFSRVESVKAGWTPLVDTDRPFTITFADEHIGHFYPDLQQFAYAMTDRLDHQVAARTAQEVLKQYFNEQITPRVISAEAYQGTGFEIGGGLTLLPYSDADLFLSAHVAASPAAELFDKGQLVEYFQAILNDHTQTTERHAISLYGLAALQEPVLIQVREVLKSDKITDADRIYLTLALVELGDYESARVLFGALNDAYGTTVDVARSITLPNRNDKTVVDTMLMALIAAHIQDPVVEQLYHSIELKDTQDALMPLLKTLFLAEQLQHLPTAPVKITYSLSGEQQTVELEKGSTASVALTSQTRDTFSLTSVEGKAHAILHSVSAPTTETFKNAQGVAITRSYDKEVAQEGDIVKITLQMSAPGAYTTDQFQITDVLPAGLRPITSLGTGYSSYPYMIDGQRVSFSTSPSYSNTVTYYARVVNTGMFTADAPLVQSFNSPSIHALGVQQTLTIGQ